MTYRLFDEFAHRYDLHTPPDHYKDDQAFVIRRSLARGLPTRLLDVGCGTGVLLERALSAGIDALGIDASAGMVNAAAAKVDAGRVRQLKMQELNERGAYDTITALSWTLNYCRSEEELRDVLGRCRAALRPGGELIAQVAHAPNSSGQLGVDRESGTPSGDADIWLFYRYSRCQDTETALQADYVYASVLHDELVFETHRLANCDANRVRDLALSVGYDTVELFDSFRGEPFGSSISPFLIAGC